MDHPVIEKRVCIPSISAKLIQVSANRQYQINMRIPQNFFSRDMPGKAKHAFIGRMIRADKAFTVGTRRS